MAILPMGTEERRDKVVKVLLTEGKIKEINGDRNEGPVSAVFDKLYVVFHIACGICVSPQLGKCFARRYQRQLSRHGMTEIVAFPKDF